MMIIKTSSILTRLVLPFLLCLAACGGTERAESPDAATSRTNTETLARAYGKQVAPSLELQFRSINEESGYPFTFRYWNDEEGSFIGDDPSLMQHYQGVSRVLSGDGTSYLYISRNGNPIVLTGHDYPGEILIVEMGDRTQSGEVFSQDFLNEPFGYGLAQPLPQDHSVKSIHLNGIDLGQGVDWKHPGSGQQAGDYLFIPVEKTCNYLPNEQRCGSGEEIRGAILVFRVHDKDNPALTPADPAFLCQIERFRFADQLWDLPLIGNLAVDNHDGNLLFTHTTGGGFSKDTALTFYEVAENELCSNIENGPPSVHGLSQWNADDLIDGASGAVIGDHRWSNVDNTYLDLDWQAIQFIRDHDNKLHLIGTDKSGDGAAITHEDWARLYRVERDGNTFDVYYLAEKHFKLKKAFWMGEEYSLELGNFDKVGAAYVSPSGRLMLYCAAGDNKWNPFIFGTWPDDMGVCNGSSLCNGLAMGEFASNYYHPPSLELPLNQEVDEGSAAVFVGGLFQDWFTTGQSWSADVDWDDGDVDAFSTQPGQPLPLEHTYPDGPALYGVRVVVSDSDGFSTDGTFEVKVLNVAPEVVIDTVTNETGAVIGSDVGFVLIGMPIEVIGGYADPGVVDTHSGTITWGDSTEQEILPLDQTISSLAATHAYGTDGNFTLEVTVTDNDGGTGATTYELMVFDSSQALVHLCQILDDMPTTAEAKQTDRISNAYAALCGNRNGLAANGALEMLDKGNLNAALLKMGVAVKWLSMPAPPDLNTFAKAIVLVAKSTTLKAITQAEALATSLADTRKLDDSNKWFFAGNLEFRSGNFVQATAFYEKAQRIIQSIKPKTLPAEEYLKHQERD